MRSMVMQIYKTSYGSLEDHSSSRSSINYHKFKNQLRTNKIDDPRHVDFINYFFSKYHN